MDIQILLVIGPPVFFTASSSYKKSRVNVLNLTARLAGSVLVRGSILDSIFMPAARAFGGMSERKRRAGFARREKGLNFTRTSVRNRVIIAGVKDGGDGDGRCGRWDFGKCQLQESEIPEAGMYVESCAQQNAVAIVAFNAFRSSSLSDFRCVLVARHVQTATRSVAHKQPPVASPS
jgi:hypothetical protein